MKNNLNVILNKKIKSIITSSDFYFFKGQQALKHWLALEVTNEMRADLLDSSFTYKQFKSEAQFEEIRNLLFEIISYCDSRANEKAQYNKYEDNRTLANAAVRMNHWVSNLIKFKFKPSEVKSSSVINALNYLLEPKHNCTILSEAMRESISSAIFKVDNYQPDTFVQNLISYFAGENLKTNHPDNYTYLLSNLIYELNDKSNIETSALPEIPLNQILFGPPGTGKTYSTINLALDILYPNKDDNKLPSNRSDVKELFKEEVEKKKVWFTTFHQSMSYEDFVEGIKPVPVNSNHEEGNGIFFDIKPGIFWQACAYAAYNFHKKLEGEAIHERGYTFEELYDAFIYHIETKNKVGEPLTFFSMQGNEIEVRMVNKNRSIIASAKGSMVNPATIAPLTRDKIRDLYNRFPFVEDIKTLKDIADTVKIQPRHTEFYAIFKGLKEFEQEFKTNYNDSTESFQFHKEENEIFEEFKEGAYRDAIKKGVEADPVVLIIDEINRGNISSIFGELITLVEKDKRLGEEEELEVILPYSKTKFSVPPNLYIIGTMNTADRSIEALDTALRRRFSFHEMAAKPDIFRTEGKISQLESPGVVEGVDVVKMLETINQRIEKLIDKDHQIGHSYFIDVTSKDELEAVFKYKVIPLLEEYFFGDFGKIGLVLGNSFVEEQLLSKSFQFATFNDYDSSLVNDLKERKVYRIKPSGWNFNSIYEDKTIGNESSSGD